MRPLPTACLALGLGWLPLTACSSRGATVGPDYRLTGGASAHAAGGSATGSVAMVGGSANAGGTIAHAASFATVTGGSPPNAGGSRATSTNAEGATTQSGGAGGATTLPKLPAISEMRIEPNPNSTLSCYVSWKTDIASTSEVEFGTNGYQFRIKHDKQTTEHRVLVIGMHAATTYAVQAVSTNAAGSTRVQGQFTTGELPQGLPVATLTTRDLTASQRGWTLVNLMPAGSPPSFQGTMPGIIVMYDEAGLPVWYYVNGNTPDKRGDVSLRILPNRNILLGPSSGEPAKEIDLAGNIVWQGPPQPNGADGAAPMSHHASKLENGNYVLLRDNSVNGIQGALVEEVTPENKVVWSWNLFDYMKPDGSARQDWCHPNSVAVDLAQDVFYLSCRWLGVIKAKRSGDKAIVWVLGGKTGGSFAFSPSSSVFDDQHEPEFHADGTVLLYNNAGESLWGGHFQSRVLEFSLQEQTMKASLEFEFPGTFSVDAWYTTNWSTPYWGDADRLANGNVLITMGYRTESRATHIVEVRRTDGKVVWEIVLPFYVGSYQAERWSPPPLVTEY